ncbi:MAG: DUF4118 domain-containing protein [Actinobacteria bacterium]|nr:DUF4118 domain-containing protein [Actinomycetota bacterium]
MGPVAPDRRRDAIKTGACIAAPLAVAAVLLPFRAGITSANIALIFVVSVLAAAIWRGRAGAIVAALSSAVWFDFFFTRPYGSFTINRADDVVTTVLLVAVGVIAGELVVRARHSEQVASAARRDAAKLRHISELAAGGEPAGALIQLVGRELVELLGLRGARWERPPYDSDLPVLRHGRILVASRGSGGRDRLLHAPGNQVALPVWGEGRELGRFVLVAPFDATGASFDPRDRADAVALADQLGAALAPAFPA